MSDAEPMRKKQRIAILIEVETPLRRHLDVLAGIQQVASTANWDTTLIPVTDFAFWDKLNQAFDGFVGRIGRSMEIKAKEHKIPAVNVWLNTDAENLPGVFPDWQQAGKMATQHLLSLGFRKLAYVGFTDQRGVQLQIAGYDASAREIAFQHTVDLFDHGYARSAADWQSFSDQLDALVATWEPRTGICVSDDSLGRFIIERCEQRGLRVPREIAIVSMENEPLVCEYTNPQLSSIDVGYQQVGVQAASLLEQLIAGCEPPENPTWLPPRGIVKRRSSDAYGVADPDIAKCLHFIATHAHEHLTVDDVATHVCLSRRTLERRFKQEVLCTVGEEITRARLEMAKTQLFESGLSIKMVARRSGFRDSSQLCAVFQRELGLSPGQFRKTHVISSTA